ncbi:MAG: hypothetical protein RIT26_1658 [Pseudomonadota bacterium]|jgi:hypothetical protein
MRKVLRVFCVAVGVGMGWCAQAQTLNAPVPVPVPNSPARGIEFSAFEIRPGDGHLRGVIQRWATDSGWSFEPQHWTLPRDIPLAGRASFESNDFRMAVRWLMRSTLQTDMPAQACFYSNFVVRVISLQENCVRTLSQE